MTLRRLAVLALYTLLSAAPLVVGVGRAHAGVHLIKIVEVFPGTTSAPNAQYVMLQMYAAGQPFTNGSAIVVFNAANVEVARFTFIANQANSANQATILIATTEAIALFGVAADLTMTPVLPLAGGSVCFTGSGDCVAWGSHVGGATVGTPFSPALGLVRGRAAVRRRDLAGLPTVLDAGDDTNNCVNDFVFGVPAPRNNAGLAGTVPASSCGSSAIEGLESCDDGNTTSGDGCSATCVDEVCADAVVNDTVEECDDGNLTSGDGCDANCRTTRCGNGVVTMGEACDDGNAASGDGCDVNCTPTACGNGVVTSGEACDDGNMTNGDGCDMNCTPTGCGNGIVTVGEDCEPPGSAGCDASCQMGCVSAAECVDADPCTTNERCALAACVLDPTPTDDAEPCTMDGCDASGVFHDPLVDGTVCTLAASPTVRALCVVGVCGASRCGDGLVDASAPAGPEECDDGNVVDTDACTAACTTARCGDGVVAATEECDDANVVDTDACTMSCTIARCGDGSIEAGVETCDDGVENGEPGHCALDCLGPVPDPDAGSAADAGASADAGEADAGAAMDAGTATDAGPPDVDAGPPAIDAGSDVDAGAPVDGGTLIDAGPAVDAGRDAGSRDAGPRIDTSPPSDASSGADAGNAIATTGCGCRAGASRSSSLALLSASVAAFVVARVARRRSVRRR